MKYSPYLQALQQIPGTTLKEKRQTLTTIAQQEIEKFNNTQNSIKVCPSELLLMPLIPWVKLEICQILKQHHFIITSLSSNDQAIICQALKVKWLFQRVGSVGYPDHNFFKCRIFPFMSLRNRNKLIKVLAANLRSSIVAERFYICTNEHYGLDQARPFLKKCHDAFIKYCIKTYKIRLTLKEIEYIYYKYPLFIIEYLNLQSDDEDENGSTSNSQCILRSKVILRKFLPRLLKNHPADFSKLVEKYKGTLEILLKNYKTYLFLKQERQALLNNPHLFFPMLSLKKATFLLSKDEFTIVFQKLFPLRVIDFKFMDVYNLLEFMPQKEKLPLILKTFKETYSYELTYCYRVLASAMKYFPREERYYQAKRLINDDSNWLVQSRMDMRRSWKCYLPLRKPFFYTIFNDINRCTSYLEIVYLFQRLIFSCGVNEDFEAMLDVLEYMLNYYEDMKESESVKIFDQITQEFDLTPHIPLYWEELYEFIFQLNIRTGIYDSVENIWTIIVWGIRIDLERNQNIDEKIVVLTDINRINRIKPIWNILKDVPFFEKICLDGFLEAIFSSYILHQRHNTDVWKNAIVSLVSAMYDFNHRYASRYNSFFEKFFVRHSFWLKTAVNKLLSDYFDKIEDFDCRELITLLKENEPIMLEKFLGEDLCNIPRAIITLKKDIDLIVDKWEIYYKSCKRNITKKSTKIFLRHIKWSAYLPRLFVQECFREIRIYFDTRILKILAILLETSEFESIIKAYINKMPTQIFEKEIKLRSKTIKLHYLIFIKLAETIKYMNMPLFPVWIEQLCESGYMPIILECLTGLERRLPIIMLEKFIELFLSMFPNSVAKHAVRIIQSAASFNDFQHLLVTMWENPDNEVETRTFLIKNMYDFFIMKPTDSTWEMMLLCLSDLNSQDEADALDIIACYKKVSDRYKLNYIENILIAFINIQAQSQVSRVSPAWYYISDIIKSFEVKTVNLFPERLHELILENLFANVSVSNKLIKILINYFINYYISPACQSLLEGRLNFFSRIFNEMLTNYLQKLDNDNETFIFVSINAFLHEFINHVIFKMSSSETKTMLVNAALENFLAVLTPQHNIEFYCYLKFIVVFDENICCRELARKIDEILLTLTEHFSTSCLRLISNYLYKFITFFYCNKTFLLYVIDHLINYNKRNNTYFATCLLMNMTISSEDNYIKYRRILTSLKQHTDSLIVSAANLIEKSKFM